MEKCIRVSETHGEEYLNATKGHPNDIHAVANDIPSILDVNTFLVYFGDKGKTVLMRLSNLVHVCIVYSTSNQIPEVNQYC